MRNAEIAAAFDELGDLYELDGADRYRVLAYRDAAKAIRDSPVSVGELAARGPGDRAARGSARRSQEKIDALLETGEIPAAEKLKAKFPAEPGRGHAAPRPRRRRRRAGSTTSSASTTLEELRAAAEDERLRERQGPRRRRSRRTCSPRSSRLAERGRRASARPALQGAAGRRGAGRGAARAPGRRPGRGRRLGAALGRDLQGHRHRSPPPSDPARARRGARRAPADRRVAAARATNGARAPDPQRDRGRPAGRRARASSATCSSTSPAPRQHNVAAARARACSAGCTSPSTGSPTTRPARRHRCATEEEVYERLGLAYIEPELREGRGELEAARERRAARAGHASTTSAATCTATRRSRTAATRSRRWREAARERGYAYLAITDHSATPRLRQRRHRPTQLRARIEEIRALQRAARRASALLAGIGGQHRPRRLARLRRRRCSPQLDWVIASVHTSFRIGRERDDRAHDRRDRAPAASTASATRPGA